MKKSFVVAALALLAYLAPVAPAVAQTNHVSGITLGAGTTCLDTDYQFASGSGTPSIGLSGCMPAVSAGYAVQAPDGGWTFSFTAEAAAGEFERCVRDGNAIVQCLRAQGIIALIANIGYQWQNGVEVSLSAGRQRIELVYEQSCGVGAAYVSGHCRNAGGPNGYSREAEDAIESWMVGLGFGYHLTPAWSVRADIDYTRADARTRSFDGPNGVGGALNPIAPAETDAVTFRVRLVRQLQMFNH